MLSTKKYCWTIKSRDQTMNDSCVDFTNNLSNALSQDAVVNKFAAMLEKALKRASSTNSTKPELSTDTRGAELKPQPYDQTQLSEPKVAKPSESDSPLSEPTSCRTEQEIHPPDLMHTSTPHLEILASDAQSAATKQTQTGLEVSSSKQIDRHPLSYRLSINTVVLKHRSANHDALFGHTPKQALHPRRTLCQALFLQGEWAATTVSSTMEPLLNPDPQWKKQAKNICTRMLIKMQMNQEILLVMLSNGRTANNLKDFLKQYGHNI